MCDPASGEASAAVCKYTWKAEQIDDITIFFEFTFEKPKEVSSDGQDYIIGILWKELKEE